MPREVSIALKFAFVNSRDANERKITTNTAARVSVDPGLTFQVVDRYVDDSEFEDGAEVKTGDGTAPIELAFCVIFFEVKARESISKLQTHMFIESVRAADDDIDAE